jgi:glycosyltransferase involved in cell wall biosynthesis
MAGKISVVIPLYNKAKHIGRALESVLAQVIPANEIIVVDDGSKDGGGEVVKSYNDSRIRLVTQENQGVSVARNRGITEANGELIAFLDADDSWKPRFLKVIQELRRQYPNAGIYAAAHETIDPNGKLKKPLSVDNNVFFIKDFLDVIFEKIISTSSIAIPKKIFMELGGFPVGEKLAQDGDMWVRIIVHYPVVWTNEILSTYYQDAGNRSQGFNLWSAEPAVSKTIRKIIKDGKLHSERVMKLKEVGAYYQLIASRHCLLQGEREMALQLLDYARGTKKYRFQWYVWRLIALLPWDTHFILRWLWKIRKDPMLLSLRNRFKKIANF